MIHEDDLDDFFDKVRTSDPVAQNASLNNGGGPAPGFDWSKSLGLLDASCWAVTGSNYMPVTKVVDKLPAGAYTCRISDRGPFLERMKISIDDLLHLPDSATEILLNEFNTFWKLKPAFTKRGFTFKRGLLMWGPPGSGKTSAVWQMTERIIKDHDGVVLFVDHPGCTVECLKVLRRIEPDRPINVVYEDIDAIINNHGEHMLLGLLDGEFQTDNVVHIATTNYPHRLDKRFVDRPSRFDTIMKVGMPSAAARLMYFRAKEPELSESTLKRWVARTEYYSVAHLREVCIATQCFGQDEEDVFARLDKMKEAFRADDDGNPMNRVGF